MNLLTLAVVDKIIVQVGAVNKSQEVGRCWRRLFGELEKGLEGDYIRSEVSEVML